MKKFFLTLGVALFAVQVDAQYGSIELSSGGFSFIPDFTSRDPHIILSAGTGTGKRLSAHFLSLIRTNNLTPRNAIFITRYQLIDRRFKLSIGTHLPGLQITDDFTVDSFFGQEVLTNYRINDKWSLRSMYLHGKGRNLDLEMNFFTAGAAYAKGKLNAYSQFWTLDLDNAFGFSQSVGYQLAPHYSLRLFANQTLTGEKDFIATIGLNRSF
jgi:hypothetical protein